MNPPSTGSFEILAQPDEVTCGPTSLHAVYRHYGLQSRLVHLIRDVCPRDSGGTLGGLLATHALGRGFSATLYTYNIQLFDPTWAHLDRDALIAKLEAQQAVKPRPRVQVASAAYRNYLEAGGTVRQDELDGALIDSLLEGSRPVLVGLCATYLYRIPRELEDTTPDDVLGESSGHFVVLLARSPERQTVTLADPYAPNPFGALIYEVAEYRFLAALYLGVLTFDANLIVLEPPTGTA